ncbi:MAG TPA: ATP-dependent Clp protease proteolytic subunit, partial [Streptomyces sp.]|nr:ATP-dependent Clp protease proteolytic subunit [Streptomyces sp.]
MRRPGAVVRRAGGYVTNLMPSAAGEPSI